MTSSLWLLAAVASQWLGSVWIAIGDDNINYNRYGFSKFDDSYKTWVEMTNDWNFPANLSNSACTNIWEHYFKNSHKFDMNWICFGGNYIKNNYIYDNYESFHFDNLTHFNFTNFTNFSNFSNLFINKTMNTFDKNNIIETYQTISNIKSDDIYEMKFLFNDKNVK